MGVLLAFMFLGIMMCALVLLPALACYLLKPVGERCADSRYFSSNKKVNGKTK